VTIDEALDILGIVLYREEAVMFHGEAYILDSAEKRLLQPSCTHPSVIAITARGEGYLETTRLFCRRCGVLVRTVVSGG
jgi:hypothetical protein